MFWALGLMLGASAALAGQPSKRPTDEEKGRVLYERSCAMCHGDRGAGDGPAAAALPGGVPTLDDQLPQDRWDAQLDVVMGGRLAMPAFAEELDRRDARRIFIYLEKLASEPPPDPDAEDDDTDEDAAARPVPVPEIP